MNDFETMIFNLLLHFMVVVMLFIGFCAVVFIFILTLIVVWNFISEGYKCYKKWRQDKND